MDYASKGVANAGLATGIAGTALGLMNGVGGGILGSFFNGRGNCCSEDQYVNRYDLNLVQELINKDQRIAVLEADNYTDTKLLALTNQMFSEVKDINQRIDCVERKAAEESKNNAVYAATMNGTVSCMTQAIAQLQSLTKLVVPNTSVCPGWGNVTITPAATTTTTTPAA